MMSDNSKCCLLYQINIPNHYKALEIYTGYTDGLDIVILFSYPSSIETMRDYHRSIGNDNCNDCSMR